MAEQGREVSPTLIHASGLGLHVPGKWIVQDFNCQIPRVGLTALCGENGSGKTELLLILSGRMKHNVGTLEIDGYQLPKDRNKMRRMASIAFFKGINDVQPALTVHRLVSAELELYGKPSSTRYTEEYLRLWALSDVSQKRAEELTAEESVRLGVALGMVPRPRILVVDDVETGLTQRQGRKIMMYLRSIAKDLGIAIIVGCNEYEIARCADNVALLSPAAREQFAAFEDAQKLVFGTNEDAPVLVGGVAEFARPASAGQFVYEGGED